MRRQTSSLFVPAKAIVTTTELTFVIRVVNGTEWVKVAKGQGSGDLVEVFGGLKEGDRVVRRGTDEIRAGTALGR